jgi:hypothetical protein
MEHNRLNNIVRNYYLTREEEPTQHLDISKSGKMQKRKNEPIEYFSKRRTNYDILTNPYIKLTLSKYDHLTNEICKQNEYILTPYGIINVIFRIIRRGKKR